MGAGVSGDLPTWSPSFSLRPRAQGLGRSGAGTAGLHPASDAPKGTGHWPPGLAPLKGKGPRASETASPGLSPPVLGGAEGGRGELCCRGLWPEV